MRRKAPFYQSLFYLGPELLEIAAWPNCNNDILLQFFNGNKKQEKARQKSERLWKISHEDSHNKKESHEGDFIHGLLERRPFIIVSQVLEFGSYSFYAKLCMICYKQVTKNVTM